MTMCKMEPFKFRDGTMRGRTLISNTPGTGAPSDGCRMNLPLEEWMLIAAGALSPSLALATLPATSPTSAAGFLTAGD